MNVQIIGSSAAVKINGEIKWLNCAKFVAIIAVLIDHTCNVLYSNIFVQYASFFSVSLFVVISGMTFYVSDSRHGYSWGKMTLHSCAKIVPAYLLAVFIYQIVHFRYFDFKAYLQYIVGFNMLGPFYYVFLYIQLMLIGKVLCSFINRKHKEIIYEILLGGGNNLHFISNSKLYKYAKYLWRRWKTIRGDLFSFVLHRYPHTET